MGQGTVSLCRHVSEVDVMSVCVSKGVSLCQSLSLHIRGCVLGCVTVSDFVTVYQRLCQYVSEVVSKIVSLCQRLCHCVIGCSQCTDVTGTCSQEELAGRIEGICATQCLDPKGTCGRASGEGGGAGNCCQSQSTNSTQLCL